MGYQRCRFDAADATFKVPVTAQNDVAGTIDRRCHIGVRRQRNGIDEPLAFDAITYVAAVNEDIAIFRHLRPNECEAFSELAGDGIGQDPRGAQQECVGCTVADEVDRLYFGLPGQGSEDLLHPVLRLVDDDDIAPARPFGGQSFVAFDTAVDEDEGAA